jgi:hypothetical protein
MDLRFDNVRIHGHGLDAPRPLRLGLPLVAFGLLPLSAGAAGLIRPLSGLVFAAILAAAGVLRASLAYHELLSLRRAADRELRLEPWPYLESSLVAWRSAELTSDHYRTAVARTLARTERDLSPARLPGASPLNRVAARPHADLLRRLAERLAAVDRPVTARGVLEVEDFLTSADSPLYERERAHELRASLLSCLNALEPAPTSLLARRIEHNGFLLADRVGG